MTNDYAAIDRRIDDAERALADSEGWDLDAKRNYGRGVDSETAAFLRRHRQRAIAEFRVNVFDAAPATREQQAP